MRRSRSASLHCVPGGFGRGRATHAQSGFTLIAMALILMVAAVTITAILPDEVHDNAAKIILTQKRLDTIKTALENHALSKGVDMPCPARIDRIYTAAEFQQPVTDCDLAMTRCDTSDPTFNNYKGIYCSLGSGVVAGGVPVAALNLSDSYMLDGWGNKIIYIVDSAATRLAGPLPTTYSSAFQIYGIDTTAPRNMRGGLLMNTILQRPVSLLLSTGANANGAVGYSGIRKNCNLSAYDGQNCDFNTDMIQYVSDRFRKEDGDFDDILVPVMVEMKNCKEPTPCTFDSSLTPVTPTPPTGSPVRKTPQGCVTRSLVTWPIVPGDNTHDAVRGSLRCCDGTWGTTGC